MVRCVVCLIEDGMPSRFQFCCVAVFVPNRPVGGGEAEEDSGGSVCHVQFSSPDPGLFHSHMAAENADV